MLRSRFTVRTLALAALTLLGLSLGQARADFISKSSPDAAYLSSTTLIPIADPDFTDIGSATDGTLTVTFSSTVNVRSIGSGWATWSSPPDSESSTPRILYTDGAGAITLTFSQPIFGFGVEMEPNPFSVFSMTAQFFDGATLVGEIIRDVDGNAGARLFAGATTTEQFTHVTLSIDGETDFAFAQMRYSLDKNAFEPNPTPEPASLTLLGLGLIGMGGYTIRRRKTNVVA